MIEIPPASAIPIEATDARKEYLRKLLCPLWLKPESALWYAHEIAAIKALLGNGFSQPSLEFGCMDGTNSFLILGGEFGFEFDAYTEVKWSQESHVWHSLKDDYFNTYKPDWADRIDIRTPANDRFSVGLSWKEAHVAKASRLGIFDQVVCVDPSQPLRQFGDKTFATMWAPNLYWIEDLAPLVKELSRMLRDDGRIVTIFPDTSQLDCLLFPFGEQTNPDWVKDLDRGRYGNAARQARTLDGWAEFFAEAGLQINRRIPFLPTVVARVYDIGLRPMFPVFMDIYETLRSKSPSDWLRIKEHWIKTAYHFLHPLCEDAWMDKMGLPRVWHAFECVRRPSRRV